MIIVSIVIFYLLLGILVFRIGLEMFKEEYPNKYITNLQMKLMMVTITLFWFPLLIYIVIEMLFSHKEGEKEC